MAELDIGESVDGRHEQELQELLKKASELLNVGRLEDALFVIHNAESATEALIHMNNVLNGDSKDAA